MSSAVDFAGENFIQRKIWTRDEAHALVECGFPNAEKLELIEGDLINRMGKKYPHVLWQNLMHEWLRKVFGFECVQSESPIELATDDARNSEPEPDLIVTKRSIRDYKIIPSSSDLKLVVEISDTTLPLDLKVKARLYARAEIIEYWVVNINDQQIVVHREPKRGAYLSITTYRADQSVSPLAAPEASLSLDQIASA